MFHSFFQFGNKVGKGRFSGKSPTYIYPECAKKVIRAIVEEDLKEYDDPHSSKVRIVAVYERLLCTYIILNDKIIIKFYAILACKLSLTIRARVNNNPYVDQIDQIKPKNLPLALILENHVFSNNIHICYFVFSESLQLTEFSFLFLGLPCNC